MNCDTQLSSQVASIYIGVSASSEEHPCILRGHAGLDMMGWASVEGYVYMYPDPFNFQGEKDSALLMLFIG